MLLLANGQKLLAGRGERQVGRSFRSLERKPPMGILLSGRSAIKPTEQDHTRYPPSDKAKLNRVKSKERRRCRTFSSRRARSLHRGPCSDN